MWTSLILLALIYVSAHVYLVLKTTALFPGVRCAWPLVAVWLLLMLAAPILVWMLEHRGWLATARVLGLVAYVWMAVLFWFCALGLVMDGWHLVVRLLAAQLPAALAIPPRAAMAVTAALIAAAIAWGVFEASWLRVRTLVVNAPRLPPGPEIRVVQISDVHFGIHRGERFARRIVDLVTELKPDLLVSTGDLVDSSFKNIGHLAERLAAIRPPLGKLAVFGNHEYYAGRRESEEFHAAAGFRVLREEWVQAGPGFAVAGIDDKAGGNTGQVPLADESAVLLGPGAETNFVLLLQHRPRVSPRANGRFDLQLSGHTHGGQIFPFGAFARMFYPYVWGRHRVGERSELYVSRGGGTWGPPLRVFAPPEVTLILLRPGQGSSSP